MASKANIIREYLPLFPDMGPSELAKKISSERHIEVQPSAVSTLRKQMKEQAPAPALSPATEIKPRITSTDIVACVAALKRCIDAIGKDQARQLLEML